MLPVAARDYGTKLDKMVWRRLNRRPHGLHAAHELNPRPCPNYSRKYVRATGLRLI